MKKVSVDRAFLKRRVLEEDKNSLFKALKANDAKAAKQALTGMSGNDLGLTHQEFGNLTQAIANAVKNYRPNVLDPDSSGGFMDDARKILGVGKDSSPSQMTARTHNPVTGQPWSSGPATDPVKQRGKGSKFLKIDKTTAEALDELFNSNDVNARATIRDLVDDWGADKDVIRDMAAQVMNTLDNWDNSDPYVYIRDNEENVDALALCVEIGMANGVWDTVGDGKMNLLRKVLHQKGAYERLGLDFDPDLT
jgi:hypothetical protein